MLGNLINIKIWHILFVLIIIISLFFLLKTNRLPQFEKKKSKKSQKISFDKKRFYKLIKRVAAMGQHGLTTDFNLTQQSDIYRDLEDEQSSNEEINNTKISNNKIINDKKCVLSNKVANDKATDRSVTKSESSELEPVKTLPLDIKTINTKASNKSNINGEILKKSILKKIKDSKFEESQSESELCSHSTYRKQKKSYSSESSTEISESSNKNENSTSSLSENKQNEKQSNIKKLMTEEEIVKLLINKKEIIIDRKLLLQPITEFITTRKPSKGEALCKQVVEDYFGENFKTVRPVWLKNNLTGYPLEIDIYNHDLRLGVEYNGRQHEIWPSFKNFTEEKMKEQVYRDWLKGKLCQLYGIKLITVPHRIALNKKAIKKYILKQYSIF